MARIIYLGDDFPHSTSAHRAAALRRLGHEVLTLNPSAFILSHRAILGLNVRTGFRLFAAWVGTRLQHEIETCLRRMGRSHVDLVWIDGCPELPPSFYHWLRQAGFIIVNYNVDDPFGRRDRRKWDLYLAAVSFHDLTVVVREENVAEAQLRGSRRVLRVYRSYDPVAHLSMALTGDDCRVWGSEVVFVGAWMPERGPFMTRLLELGVPLTIYGHSWEKAPEWPRLRSAWRGSAIYGPDYVKAIQCAKVALGLLSKGNRDLHTTRSAEVPFIGGAVFCAERTPEHSFLFQEEAEAAFWNDAEECAQQCHDLLASGPRRRRMVEAARRRIIAHELSNDAVLTTILSRVLPAYPAPVDTMPGRQRVETVLSP